MNKSIAIFLALSSFIFLFADAKNTICTQTSLQKKSCTFELNSLKISVKDGLLTVGEKNKRDRQSLLPVRGANTEWEDIRITQLNQRSFIEVLAWKAPDGEMPGQALIWSVFEIKNNENKLVVSEEIQVAEVKPKKRIKFSRSQFGLKSANDGTIIWYRDDEQNIIE